jgi:hypothetical protein
MSIDRRRRYLGSAVLSLALVLAACTIGEVDGEPVAQPPSTEVAVTEPPGPIEEIPVPPSVESILRSEFGAVAEQFDGSLGMAYIPVGGGQVHALGDWSTGVAWSTIKVPLAIAALRNDQLGTADAAAAAIRNSDNSAAESLWQSLGGSTSAAAAVEKVLLEGGDDGTAVQPERKRDGFSAFGQSEWTITRQAQFASEIPCLDMGPEVVELMGRVSPDQRWGLGRIDGAAFKGGWGPDEQGGYLVRQLGIIEVPGGYTALAVAAEPTSGSFHDGIAMVDAVATMLGANPELLPFGQCT